MMANPRALSYGMFFGANERRRELPGFSVSLLTPTLRAEDVPLHTHDTASFVVVLAGTYLSSADGAPPDCASPMVIFNPAGTTHRDSFRLAEGRFLAISLADPVRRLAAEQSALPAAATAFVAGAAVATAVKLARLSLLSEPEARDMMEGLSWELLGIVAGEGRASPQRMPPWLRQAREMLHDRCAGPLRITEMAEQTGVHPVYFARAFRQAFGCTPGEYRMRCRLRKAMALLRDSSFLLSEVALAAGFFDQSHLTRAFRQHFGLAPNAFRQRMRGDEFCGNVQSVQDAEVRMV